MFIFDVDPTTLATLGALGGAALVFVLTQIAGSIYRNEKTLFEATRLFSVSKNELRMTISMTNHSRGEKALRNVFLAYKKEGEKDLTPLCSMTNIPLLKEGDVKDILLDDGVYGFRFARGKTMIADIHFSLKEDVPQGASLYLCGINAKEKKVRALVDFSQGDSTLFTFKRY